MFECCVSEWTEIWIGDSMLHKTDDQWKMTNIKNQTECDDGKQMITFYFIKSAQLKVANFAPLIAQHDGCRLELLYINWTKEKDLSSIN